MYTDGIVEARASTTQIESDETIDEYQMDRLEQLVQSQHTEGPGPLIRAVMRDVHQYTSPLSPHDDCTMIALRFEGHGG